MLNFLFKKPNKSKESASDKIKKLNPSQYYNQGIEYKPKGEKEEDSIENNKYMVESFERLFNGSQVDLKELRTLSANGIPQRFRSKAWKILSDYVSPNLQQYESTLEFKRKEYSRMRTQHYEENFEKNTNKRLQEGLSTIHKDVDRTLGETKMFQSRLIKDILVRILYIYHVRNSESGYAQGMNDIAAPFIILFTKEYITVDSNTLLIDPNFESMLSEEILLNIEADSYWCFTRLLSCIKNNFTPSFPGVIEMLNKLHSLIEKLDPELDKIFKKNNIRYYDICFQWFLCLLLRQFSAKLKFRLLDFYFTDKENINEWLVYIGASLMLKFSNKLKDLKAYDKILMFFTNLRTEDWGELDMGMLLGEAHIYKNSYNYSELNGDAPNMDHFDH